jgi:hypothetical protein
MITAFYIQDIGMANTEQDTVQHLNQQFPSNQVGRLWPLGAAPALPREIGEHVRRLLNRTDLPALRLTSRAARVFSDGCVQGVRVERVAHLADLAAAAPRLAALRVLCVMTHCASDVAALAAALPSLGRHCRIVTLQVTYAEASGQLDLVAARLPATLRQLTHLEVQVEDSSEQGSTAAACHAAYVAAAAQLPLLECLCIRQDCIIPCHVLFDMALHLGAWPLLQVGRAMRVELGGLVSMS